MVVNTPLVVAAANISADICRCIAFNSETLISEQVLHLLFHCPLQQFRRFAVCLWTFYSSSSSFSSA
ncbi:hypothetical protein Hanom_Chr11g01049561 [Helianthus anomalus]